MALITGIFSDEAPDTQPFPFVTLGNKNRMPWQTFGKASWEITFMADVWTAIDAGDVGFQIVAEMDDILHNKKIPMAHYDNAWTYNELTLTAPEEMRHLTHIAARYRSYLSLL